MSCVNSVLTRSGHAAVTATVLGTENIWHHGNGSDVVNSGTRLNVTALRRSRVKDSVAASGHHALAISTTLLMIVLEKKHTTICGLSVVNVIH